MSTYRRTYSLPRWDFRKLMVLLGPINVIRDKLFAYGYEAPPAESIYGWRKRNAVPGSWSLVLLNMAFKEGLITGIDQLTLSEGEEPDPIRKKKPEKETP